MAGDEASGDAVPGAEAWDGTTSELASALRDLAKRLRDETIERVPPEPSLASASAVRRVVKTRLFRSIRPATRRFDRLAADLATVAADLAERLAILEDRATGGIERLELEVSRLSSGAEAAGAPGGEAVPDAFYWAFEERMRGSTESVRHRLAAYEGLARRQLDRLRTGDGPTPRWVDLGCGNGEFCELLRDWGWTVEGVDASPAAVEECRRRGIDVTLADAPSYLETRPPSPLGGISAIQLIEHLPRERWVAFFEGAFRALAPGGALLVETINGRNARAVADHFNADVTHTWPGHPETLRLMAAHAGFRDVEVLFQNDDATGSAQDVAIWARTASDDVTAATTPSGRAPDGPPPTL
jgi:SAM-dependent methyltransferase